MARVEGSGDSRNVLYFFAASNLGRLYPADEKVKCRESPDPSPHATPKYARQSPRTNLPTVSVAKYGPNVRFLLFRCR